MQLKVCTGFGSSDTHSLILNDGRQNPHPSAGKPYQLIGIDDIWSMLQNEQTVDKEKGQWIIPSEYHQYDARSHEVQRLNGLYHFMAADIDQGSPSLEEVMATVGQSLGDAYALIYATRSATELNKKWRILIPLSNPLPGKQYGPFQASLFDALEHLGLQLDRTLERTGQLVYLPNRGQYWEWRWIGNKFLDPHQHPMAHRAAQYLQVQEQLVTGNSQRNETNRSPVAAFRRKHSIEEKLIQYGYRRNGHTNHWASPYQTSGGFATVDREDHWISLSDSDKAAGIGKATSNGSRYGDAFDLYVHYECGGDYEKGMVYARQCLQEEDDGRYGDASVEHGKQILDQWMKSYNKASADVADLIRQSSIEVDESQITNDEWKIDWPPGAVGELAKWIHNSASRPIKQYSIAAALYFFSVSGRKYNIDGQGLNLYLMLVGETGRGKGVVKSAIDRLVSAIATQAQNPGLVAPFNYEIAVSESGIRKALSKQNPICAYEEELGLSLLPLTSPKASANDIGLRKMLTRLYDSGEGRTLGRKEASDQDRVRDMVYMPCMTMAGDTQPHIYRGMLGNDAIDGGFAPRMIPFFYYGKRKHHNEDSHDHRYPPAPLVTALRVILEYCLTSGEAVNHIRWAPGVKERLAEYGREVDNRINDRAPGAEMLNRVDRTVARVAAILAVGVNHLDPVITMECYEYSRQVIEIGLEETQKILASGGAGSGESVRIFKLRDAVKKFITGAITVKTKLETYKTPKKIVDRRNLINENFLIKFLALQADFKGGDVKTTEDNVRACIKEAIAQGIIEEAVMVNLDARTKQKVYQVGPDY